MGFYYMAVVERFRQLYARIAHGSEAKEQELPPCIITRGEWVSAKGDDVPYKGIYVTKVPCIVDTAKKRNIPGYVERRYYVLHDDTVVLQGDSRLIGQSFPYLNQEELQTQVALDPVIKRDAQIFFGPNEYSEDEGPVLVYTPIIRKEKVLRVPLVNPYQRVRNGNAEETPADILTYSGGNWVGYPQLRRRVTGFVGHADVDIAENDHYVSVARMRKRKNGDVSVIYGTRSLDHGRRGSVLMPVFDQPVNRPMERVTTEIPAADVVGVVRTNGQVNGQEVTLFHIKGKLPH